MRAAHRASSSSTQQGTNSPTPELRAVILFDGVCNLCNGAVRFVIERDPAGRFQFAALQSAAAARLVGSRSRDRLPDSIVLVEDGRLWTRSTAALRIARRLRFPWPAAYAMIVVPRPLRDWIYNLVARNRYTWFGRRDACMVPAPALQARFLE
jgi:predicted DCC family thiol-disulfide oxidoreductase YuxK